MTAAFDPGSPACAHGGAFFEALGEEFDDLGRRERVINADVLDAWFDPAPAVLEALRAHLPWLLRTSPPTHSEGLVRVIARERAVPERCVLPAGGSSELIYLALPRWVKAGQTVLLLDPTYGEYAHLLEQVLGCRVLGLALRRADGYAVSLEALAQRIAEVRPSLLVLVNPNSPTGRHVPRAELEALLRGLPPSLRVWIDETYVEYAGPGQSLEGFAATSASVVVSKSMSKVYALSGVRAAYLVGPEALLAPLRPFVPPWAVGLLAQVAAVNALTDRAYYAGRWQATHALRAELSRGLASLGLDVQPSTTNFLLAHLPPSGPTGAELVRRAASAGLYLRDLARVGSVLGSHAVRLAVKDAGTNERMLAILRAALAGAPGRG